MGGPSALEIYQRFRRGESVRDLSLDLRIPIDQIDQRLKEAAKYMDLLLKAKEIGIRIGEESRVEQGDK